MIDVSVLNQNLNDQVSYEDFFKALGYTVNDTIYIRRFDDTKKSSAAQNMQAPFHRFKNMLSSLHFFNEQRQGIYFVVNGGGQGDKDVKVARAAFMEIDDRSFEEQLEIINSFPLMPSAIIKTKKSLHCYWITQDGDIKLFREIQMRLIQFFSGDPVIKNESRVMRLYGFNHCKQDPPVMVKLIWFDPEARYTQQQLLDVLPEVKSEKIVHTNTKQVAASFAKQKESLEWVRGFFQRQSISVLDERVINEGKIKLSVGCPWCDQHTQEDCIGESAVIIRKNGMIGYNCFHSHCDGRGWKEYRAFYEQDNDEDETVNSGDREVEKIGDMQANNSEKKKSIPLRWMNFSGIEQKAVDWLVPEYIPRKGITILGGDGGVGKSSIECALAAAVSVKNTPTPVSSGKSGQIPGTDVCPGWDGGMGVSWVDMVGTHCRTMAEQDKVTRSLHRQSRPGPAWSPPAWVGMAQGRTASGRKHNGIGGACCVSGKGTAEGEGGSRQHKDISVTSSSQQLRKKPRHSRQVVRLRWGWTWALSIYFRTETKIIF